ncbi:PREDICTED: kielin/chordin-like protein [Nicrophorus vespilloides]|uniref:Kielin/chordin-like protein n=1 Tax=Nicrophorus vespilloides TaxID=110193 RepID=A0ABM1MEU4_NICVS|nr:PREDICTED: kielin/chordin-like protein [Nicrophorus vespilloides]
MLIYDEIGCTPIKGFRNCITSYKCSNYRLPKQGCLFEKHVYKDGEPIKGTNPCNTCSCYDKGINGSKIECFPLIIDRGPSIPFPNDCYDRYDLNKCFSKIMCPPYKNLAVCVVNYKGYIEGEKFQAPDPCLDCVCQKGYNEKFVEPFCRKKRCDVEIKYSNQIVDNCAPIYNKNEPQCCPYDFICPQNTKIEHVFNYNSTSNVEKCKFGSQTYNQYDSLDLVNPYNVTFKCRCSIPPLLTCLR